MKKILKSGKYLFDETIKLIKYFIDASKLTLLRVKFLLFVSYIGIFSFGYYIDVKIDNSGWHVVLDTQNIIQWEGVLITAILIYFLIKLDVTHINSNSAMLKSIMENNTLSQDIRDKAANKFLKNK